MSGIPSVHISPPNRLDAYEVVRAALESETEMITLSCHRDLNRHLLTDGGSSGSSGSNRRRSDASQVPKEMVMCSARTEPRQVMYVCVLQQGLRMRLVLLCLPPGLCPPGELQAALISAMPDKLVPLKRGGVEAEAEAEAGGEGEAKVCWH